MTAAAATARTPGAKRAGPGEYVFDLGTINHIKGGPDYASVIGSVVEGDRMIVALMRMQAGTGAEPHSHPNEQWIYILEGTFKGKIGDQRRIKGTVAETDILQPKAAGIGVTRSFPP